MTSRYQPTLNGNAVLAQITLSEVGVAMAIAAAILGALGTFSGFIWWLSAIYSKINQIDKSHREFKEKDFKEFRQQMIGRLDKIDGHVDEHCDELEDHNNRIGVIEDRFDRTQHGGAR